MTAAPSKPFVQTRHSALARVVVEVSDGAGTEEITFERRVDDAVSARQWCERKIRLVTTDQAARICEIQVFEETWRTAGTWEATEPRPFRDTLQVGAATNGSVIWASPHDIATHRPRRFFA